MTLEINTTAGKFERCSACGEYGWFGGRLMNHHCDPEWECRIEEWNGDDWQRVFARDAKKAAEKYADRFDCECGDYPIVNGNERVVFVRKPFDDGPGERWTVMGEYVPRYRAEPTRDDD